MCHNNIKVLRELTQQLTFKDLVTTKDGVIQFEAGEGTAITFGLLKEDNCAVAKTFISKGSHIPFHEHDVIEHVIVYKGEVGMEFNNKQYLIKQGESISIPKNVQHNAFTKKDSWIIAITIPADNAFPDVKK